MRLPTATTGEADRVAPVHSSGSGVVQTGTVLDPHVQPGRPGAGYGFQFISTGKILVEQFTSVCEPQPCLGQVFGRPAVVVNLHVDLTSVERAADKKYVNTLHKAIFAGVAGKRRPMARMPVCVPDPCRTGRSWWGVSGDPRDMTHLGSAERLEAQRSWLRAPASASVSDV